MKTIDDFKKIVLNEIPLIDVRAQIEYDKGAFPNSVNLPILNDEERHQVGITYKEEGQAEAVKLGHELISGKTKDERMAAWKTFIENNPNSYLYCFRGGNRSKITQQWLQEEGTQIMRLEGGYKAFRNYLLDALDPANQNSIPILLGGHTGSGKTTLLKQFSNFIDLEGIANHRGSSFGRYITPQPTQINFENLLAYRLIQHHNNQYILLEDEGANIGKCFIPKPLASYFNQGGLILLNVPFETRIQNTLEEYVISSQKDHQEIYQDDGLNKWYEYIKNSIERIKKRLGGERFKQLITLFEEAYQIQLTQNSFDAHQNWIEFLLKEYYDPMYEYQINKTKKIILFKGNEQEVYDFMSKNYNQ